MRARNIKPSFFLNCDLAEIDFASRLLFIGLWCYADREGRFEWKPKQIKAAIFPYDTVDIDALLCNLITLHFITSNDMVGYIPNFKVHQHPHPNEAKSRLPEWSGINTNEINDIAFNVNYMKSNVNYMECQADIRILGKRKEDTRNADSKIAESEIIFNFDSCKFVIPQSFIDTWKSDYPNTPINSEILSAESWLRENAAKAKKYKSWPTFLNNWLKRSSKSLTTEVPDHSLEAQKAYFDKIRYQMVS